MDMGNRVDKLVKLFQNNKPIKPVNGNGVARILKNRELMKWLLLAGVSKIVYKNSKFYDNYGREIVFYQCDGRYSFYIKGDEDE